MPWGSMSSTQAMRVMLELIGGPKFIAETDAATGSVTAFGRATMRAGQASKFATTNSVLHNQAMYTGRRLAFYTSLGILGLGAAYLKLGFSYQNALQTSRVALSPVIRDQGVLNAELGKLYKIAALSPFLFKDTTVAFKNMYAAFHPLGISMEMTNKTIQAIVDSLSYAGKTSPQALSRVSIALQHMAFQGRLTGRTVQQLAMDGLPIYQVLTQRLHVTADQMHNISKLGIPTRDVLKSLINYINTTPGYIQAAMRISNQTLTGGWAQFKDIISQGAAGTTGPLFGFLQRTLKGVNEQLAPFFMKNKPISITMIADAFDKQLSPHTHIVIRLFIILNKIVRTVAFAFGGLFVIVSAILRPFDAIASWFGQANSAATILGYTLGVTATFWLLYKGAVMAATIAQDAWTAATWLSGNVMAFLTGPKGLPKLIKLWREWAFAQKTTMSSRGARGVIIPGTIANEGRLARFSRYLFEAAGNARLFAKDIVSKLVPAIKRWRTAMIEADIASYLTDPLVAVIAAVVALNVAIIVLTVKWKHLHDIISKYWWVGLIIAAIMPIFQFGILTSILIVKWHSLTGAIRTFFNVMKSGTNWIIHNWRYLNWAGPMIGGLVQVVNLVKSLVAWIHRLINVVKHPIRMKFGFGGGKGGVAGGLLDKFNPLGPAANVVPGGYGRFLRPSHYLHYVGLASGGMATRPGMAVVGEHGPELTYMPQGASVVPLKKTGQYSLRAELVAPIRLILDGRVLAESNARYRIKTQAVQ